MISTLLYNITTFNSFLPCQNASFPHNMPDNKLLVTVFQKNQYEKEKVV